MRAVVLALCLAVAGCAGMNAHQVGTTIVDVGHQCSDETLRIAMDIADAVHQGPPGWVGDIIALGVDGKADYECISRVVKEHIAEVHAVASGTSLALGVSQEEQHRAQLAVGMLGVMAKVQNGGAK